MTWRTPAGRFHVRVLYTGMNVAGQPRSIRREVRGHGTSQCAKAIPPSLVEQHEGAPALLDLRPMRLYLYVHQDRRASPRRVPGHRGRGRRQRTSSFPRDDGRSRRPLESQTTMHEPARRASPTPSKWLRRSASPDARRLEVQVRLRRTRPKTTVGREKRVHDVTVESGRLECGAERAVAIEHLRGEHAARRRAAPRAVLGCSDREGLRVAREELRCAVYSRCYRFLSAISGLNYEEMSVSAIIVFNLDPGGLSMESLWLAIFSALRLFASMPVLA